MLNLKSIVNSLFQVQKKWKNIYDQQSVRPLLNLLRKGHTTTQITQRCYCKPSTEFVVNEMSKLMGAV